MKVSLPYLPAGLALAAVFAASTALGQSGTCYYLPSNSPTTGAPDPRPFGAQSRNDPTYGTMRYQMHIPASFFGNQPVDICEVFAVPAGSRARRFTEMKVRFGHSPNPLSTQMVFNFTGFTAIRVGTGESGFLTTADTWMPLGMEAPFRYDPAFGDLALEWFVRNSGAPTGTGDAGFRTDPSLPFVWTTGQGYNGTLESGGGIKLAFCTDHHGFIEYTEGACAGSSGLEPVLTYGGSAQLGNTLQVNLSNGPIAPNTLAVIVFSFRVRTGPFTLGGFGAPGCDAFVFGDQATWLSTNNGSYSLNVPLPTTLTPCFSMWNQWFLFDPAANGLGVISSNYGRITVGN